MTTATRSLARLADEFPSWTGTFGEGRFAVPELLHLLDMDRIRVEEIRQDGAVVVRAELPGLDPEKDIEITLSEGVLQIAAHREQREEFTDEGGFRSEFHYGSFMRRLPMPDGATEDAIEATYHDGILEVRVPIEEHVTEDRRMIPITRT